jgi:hypothetical protein
MDWDTFARIIPSLVLSETIDFTGGGEPLRNPRLVEMVQAAKIAGCEVGFSTNGTRLTPQISEQLVESGLDWISFSIDAASASAWRSGVSAPHEVIENACAARLIASRQIRPAMMMVFVMMVGDTTSTSCLPAGASPAVSREQSQRTWMLFSKMAMTNAAAAMRWNQTRTSQSGGSALASRNPVIASILFLRPQEVTVCSITR